MVSQVENFVSKCQKSSHAAYECFKELLLRLDDEKQQRDAVLFLYQLKEYFVQSQPDNCHFQFLEQSVLNETDKTIRLQLLQFPSTFLPEAWSFTFYEGLIRYPESEYHNKKVIELGCGIGWISIALARRYLPNYMVGVDINPKAIICARLNLYLNAFDEAGHLIILNNGKSLLDIVAFFESNLFSHFNQAPLTADRIIGCIPQVLNPEPEVMENLIAESSSDEYLYSLSNYFAKQGYIEDQFGLGLIASAVEQSVAILKPEGNLILNLGGRPGRSVLERLMQRRGFQVRRVWQTQVEQAADTEIKALVDIEKTTGHRFEFYMSANADVPIDARTALKYAQAGGKIYHSVDVYEAKMLFPEQVKRIYQSVGLFGEQGLRSAVDLTYENYADAEERYSFLAFLSKQLQTKSHFPYESTAGLTYFRLQLAEYFRYYLRVDISEKQLFITPGRKALVENMLMNYRPQLTLISKKLSHLVGGDFDTDDTQVIQIPSQVEYLIELINKLKPQCVITQLDVHEIQSTQLIKQLIDCATTHGVLLLIDLTDNIDLSSQPSIHGVYRYLSESKLPNNLVIMAALVNNNVYQDYSLNITLTSNDTIINNLLDTAELTYSRTPVLKQLYYAHLLEELLFFQRTRSTLTKEQHTNQLNSEFSLLLCNRAKNAFSHPAIKGNHLAFNQDTIRFDYGENELSAPSILKQSLLESYLVRRCITDDSSPEELLQKLLTTRFNFSNTLYSKMLFGNGVSSIFEGLLTLCVRENKALLIPNGSYGYFYAAAQLKGVKVKGIITHETDNFKVTPELLKEHATKSKECWLFLNAPIINPTGAIYSQSELSELLWVAAENDVTVIMDSIFSGLEFDNTLNWDLSFAIDRFNQAKNARFVMLGGVSKEYAAGGLRFGYCWSTSKSILGLLEKELSNPPHFTLGYAVRKLIERQLSGEPTLISHLDNQRKTLAHRADILSSVLTNKGWQVIPPEGGLFLAAKPMKFIEEFGYSPQNGGDKMTEKLFNELNLVVNNSTWTGLPGYCRFVLSCSENDFNEGIKRLKTL